MKHLLWVWLMVLTTIPACGCIWDADTLSHEKSRSKDLASAILDNAPAPDEPEKIRARIAELNAHKDETNPEWLNNLAGAYLRLNQPAEAVKILEPVAAKFTNDYGVHANLGTAYHLLSRYADAEKEIARDLEINPNAHFGLEKYHLALLQYLVRDAKYQARHVYVDEMTVPFLMGDRGRISYYHEEFISAVAKAEFTNGLVDAESFLTQLGKTNILKRDDSLFGLLAEVSTLDARPEYRARWNLAEDTNFEAGVIYMAQMNPKEAACATMLGVAAWKKRDYNLVVKAFEKSIELNSPQSDLLQAKIDGLNYFIKKSVTQSREVEAMIFALSVFVVSVFIIIVYVITRFIRRFKKSVED